MTAWDFEIGDVAANGLIESSWGNEIRDKVVHVVSTESALPSTSDDGAIAYIEDVDQFAYRIGGAWYVGGGSTGIVRLVYTSSGTFTKASYPSLVGVDVTVIGGGGGSGYADSVPGGGGNGAAASGGGGSGAYARKWIGAGDLGTSETVTVGAGGSAGTSGSRDGGDGGASSFGSHATANGGGGSGEASARTTLPNLGHGPGLGASASGGDINVKGRDGEVGILQGLTSFVYSPKGADSMLSAQDQGGLGTSSAAGQTPGGYGGGASGTMVRSGSAGAGAAGSPGVVIVDVHV